MKPMGRIEEAKVDDPNVERPPPHAPRMTPGAKDPTQASRLQASFR
eukprot:CAMPEP_0195076240 /NCGR_PEP_ID=MMETSP0448-20130528/18940_1 /TAXON_ID=66468 /ORGANISM="Heterocapsa triquestra, Strain CCMP 448" /LENGTH=45 /DNA_ID= /DNA_START= /DNA_END= /DNA_ORIENTATION=